MDLFKRIVGAKKAEDSVTQTGAQPRHLTAEEFDNEILKAEVPAVVDFWAEWCAPCRAIAPAVAQLAGEFEGRAIVAKLNADDYPEILMRYGIMGIPTLLYLKGGQEVDRIVGLTRYETLKNKLERLL